MNGHDLLNMDKEKKPQVTALGRLLARLALDDALHREFLEDPGKVIAGAGLSAEEQDALSAGDWERIKVLLGPKKRQLPKEGPSGGN